MLFLENEKIGTARLLEQHGSRPMTAPDPENGLFRPLPNARNASNTRPAGRREHKRGRFPGGAAWGQAAFRAVDVGET
jgi:hypothetical protein